MFWPNKEAQPFFVHVVCCTVGRLAFLLFLIFTWIVCNFFGIILVYSPISLQQMAVHRLTTPSPPTSPRRSPRLGLPTRKRARISDSDQQLTPSSSKLPLSPDPSPRWIRAHKRQKVLDTPSLTSPTATPNANGSTRAGKRKSLTPPDHHELDSHHIVRKKRKENIVKDAPTANATTSSLKISVTQDTRQGGGNNVCSRLFLILISSNRHV